MSADGKVIYTTDEYTGGRYRVESLRNFGDYRFEYRGSSANKGAAIAFADALIRNGHYEARVVDTKEES